MPDKILAAVRRENNPTIVINTIRKPIIRFKQPTRGIVCADDTNIAFSEATELELPVGTTKLTIKELDQDSPIIFVEDAA